MAGVNKQILLGNIGKDPEIRHLENGQSVATFSLATSETYKNKEGEKVTNTEWHNIVAWKPFSEIVEKYAKKGDQIYLEGKSTTRSWEDKNGVKRYTTEVVVRELVLLNNGRTGNKPPEHQAEDAPPWVSNNPDNIGADDSDDLAF